MDISHIQLVNTTGRKEIAATPETVASPGEQQNTGRIPVQTMRQMQIRFDLMQPCDHGIHLLRSKTGLAQ